MFHHIAVAFGIDVRPIFFLNYGNLCTGIQQGVCVLLLAQAALPFPVWKHRNQLQIWVLFANRGSVWGTIYYRIGGGADI